MTMSLSNNLCPKIVYLGRSRLSLRRRICLFASMWQSNSVTPSGWSTNRERRSGLATKTAMMSLGKTALYNSEKLKLKFPLSIVLLLTIPSSGSPWNISMMLWRCWTENAPQWLNRCARWPRSINARRLSGRIVMRLWSQIVKIFSSRHHTRSSITLLDALSLTNIQVSHRKELLQRFIHDLFVNMFAFMFNTLYICKYNKLSLEQNNELLLALVQWFNI